MCHHFRCLQRQTLPGMISATWWIVCFGSSRTMRKRRALPRMALLLHTVAATALSVAFVGILQQTQRSSHQGHLTCSLADYW